MVYLVVGGIISLAGVGLMISGERLLGITVVLIGGSISLKGRRDIDKR